MSIIGEITAIPKNQLSDELEVADHFHANGFEFKVLYFTEDRVIAEEIADNRAFHRLSEKVNNLSGRVKTLERRVQELKNKLEATELKEG